jgi:hypothetical protein
MLGKDKRIREALTWLRRCGESATPAFIEKAAAWLAAAPIHALRTEGVGALRQGAAPC